MILTCDASGYTYLMWDDNENCQGQGRTLSDKVGVCEQSGSGSFMNTCVDAVDLGLQKRLLQPQPLMLQGGKEAKHAATSAMNQLSCTDDACSSDCQLIHNPINSCVKYTGNRSGMILTCDASGYTYLMW